MFNTHTTLVSNWSVASSERTQNALVLAYNAHGSQGSLCAVMAEFITLYKRQLNTKHCVLAIGS